MRRRANEPPAGRDDQSKVSPPLARPPGPGAARAVLTGPADGILPLVRGQCSARIRFRPPAAVRSARAAVRRPPRGRALRLRRRRAAGGGAGRLARASRRCWCGAGSATRTAARAFLAAGDAPPARRVRRPARRRGARSSRHVERGSRITVHGDYDVDGVCSTAVLVRALRTLGADVDWYLPSRIDDGYGLARGDRRAARRARHATCWSRSTARSRRSRRSRAARAAGLDVVVTDHHAPRADGALPDAPIVHPRVGGYPCPELCAAGVAHKLAQALLEAAGMDPAAADADLDLVALATVADCVPLVGENRRLVREGLRALAVDAQARAAGADGGRARGPERGRRGRDRLPARAADQRRRPAAPRRRGARAAADGRRRARARDRRGARRASTPSGATSRRGSSSRPRRRSPRRAPAGPRPRPTCSPPRAGTRA